MTEEQNIPLAPLPELPSEEDARREQMAELKPYLLDATENYPEPIYLLEYNGVPFSTLLALRNLSLRISN